jgi:hypothetical protein
MPRRKPIQSKPSTPRRQNNEFKFARNFDHCCSVPCINNRCPGFMFLVTSKYGIHTPAVDELECFVCKKVRKLGQHDPNREKPKPLARRPNDSRRVHKGRRPSH